ncbi:beta-propeller domain-containing protein [Actinomadura welshii]
MRGRAGIAAAMVLVLAGPGCTGSPGAADRPSAPPIRLVAYDTCDALHAELREATADLAGPYGLGGSPGEDGVLPDDPIALRGGPRTAEAAPGRPPRHSATNAHEPGADEPDPVKTDGRRIVTVARGALTVIDPATREITHTLALPGSGAHRDARLLLAGDRVLVLDEESPAVPLPRPAEPGAESSAAPRETGPTTRLTLVDISAAPKVIGTMTTRAGYLDARQSGSTVRVVLRSEPDIDFPGGNGTEAAAEANRRAVITAPLDAWLPSFRVTDGKGGPERRYEIPCDQVSRPASYAGSGMLSVLTFDLSRGLGDPQAIAVTADGTTVYGNGKNLYVTSTPPPPSRWRPRDKKPAEERTDVYKFDVGGGERPRYVASGSVKGFLLNQYSMSEHDGRLRLATTTGRFAEDEGRSQSSVHVLAPEGSRLAQVGRLDGLGKGERIHSVRFIGETGYVVTFREVDPLYVLDLADPRRPRRTGELKITGYSAYLHPAGDGRLLGVGQDADRTGRTTGLQVSLFDVSAAQPRRIDNYTLPEATSQAELDPHAFLHWPDTGLTVLPMNARTGVRAEAVALKVTESSITRLGTVRHPGKNHGGGINRSLIIGDTLWTFSEEGARASNAATLKPSAWLPYS